MVPLQAQTSLSQCSIVQVQLVEALPSRSPPSMPYPSTHHPHTPSPHPRPPRILLHLSLLPVLISLLFATVAAAPEDPSHQSTHTASVASTDALDSTNTWTSQPDDPARQMHTLHAYTYELSSTESDSATVDHADTGRLYVIPVQLWFFQHTRRVSGLIVPNI